jgi:hypothetical protein
LLQTSIGAVFGVASEETNSFRSLEREKSVRGESFCLRTIMSLSTLIRKGGGNKKAPGNRGGFPAGGDRSAVSAAIAAKNKAMAARPSGGNRPGQSQGQLLLQRPAAMASKKNRVAAQQNLTGQRQATVNPKQDQTVTTDMSDGTSSSSSLPLMLSSVAVLHRCAARRLLLCAESQFFTKLHRRVLFVILNTYFPYNP